MLRSHNIRGGRLHLSNVSFTDEAQYRERTRRAIPRPGDIVITREAPMGEVAMIPDGLRCCLGQRMVLLRPDPSKVDRRYLLYALQSPQVQFEIGVSEGTGSTVSNLRIPLVESLGIPTPTIEEQRRIAHILGTLDDKIELNRRMSETLEAAARALFESWFVGFDPVQARAEGRRTELADSLAALFPDRMARSSDRGPIPAGWRVGTIAECCAAVVRGVTPTYGSGSGRFVINQRVNRGVELDWSELKELAAEMVVPDEKLANPWDVLVNSLGEGTLGRTHLYLDEPRRFAIDQHMSICRPSRAALGPYLYFVLTSDQGQSKIESLKTGTTGMTMLNISRLREFDLLVPPAAILDAYFRITRHLFRRIAVGRQESRTLASIRDSLLPRLMSEKLGVRQPGAVVASPSL